MPSKKYIKNNVFKYSPVPTTDTQYRTLSPASDNKTLADINRDNSLMCINGVTMTELRMNDHNFSEDQQKLYLLGNQKINTTEINKLRDLLPKDKKDIPDAEVRSALKELVSELKTKVDFNTLEEYQEFLKKHLLSGVEDPVKKAFLAETLAQNAHQSGFYKAASAYLNGRFTSLSSASAETRGNGFRSDLLLDRRPQLFPNEVCVERYEENVLHYRAKNAVGEENTGTVELGTGKNQLSKKHMDFLIDPARQLRNNNNPKISYVGEEKTPEGRAALQALFNITSAQGHTQSVASRTSLQSEESYVTSIHSKAKVNLTCSNDTVTIDEAIKYDGVTGMNRNTESTEKITSDESYATVNSKIHISARKSEAAQDTANANYEVQFKSEGLIMENHTEVPHIKKYLDAAFSNSSLTPLQEIENILLTPPSSANEKVRETFFRALTEVGQYQKGRLSANELVVFLEALKTYIQKNEKRQSFIQRHSIIGKKNETALDCLNNAIEKAKTLPDYVSPEKVMDARAAKEKTAVTPNAGTEPTTKFHFNR